MCGGGGGVGGVKAVVLCNQCNAPVSNAALTPGQGELVTDDQQVQLDTSLACFSIKSTDNKKRTTFAKKRGKR